MDEHIPRNAGASSRRLAYLLLLVVLIAVGCHAEATTPTPETPVLATVQGTLVPTSSTSVVGGRGVALCRVTDGTQTMPTACALIAPATTADAQGRFTFEDVAPGTYLVVYASGLADFQTGMDRWAGRTLHPGNWPWLRDQYLALDAGGSANVRLPASLPTATRLDYAVYGKHTLLFEGSPFILAHEIDRKEEFAAAKLLSVTVQAGGMAQVVIPAFDPAPLDYAAIRARFGPLDREEQALLERDLVARWQRFSAGDDAAFRDTDLRVLEALRSGTVHEIGNTQLAALEEYGGDLVKRVGYVTVDVQSGHEQVVGWWDEASGDVIEARSGYRLNVRDAPGVWLEAGPHGEQFYHYGFSYYRRWGQILPDPIIALIEDFYHEGAAHFQRHAADYQAAAQSFGGDLLLVTWDEQLLDRIAIWQPSTPPFVRLPDSGAVNIRRERFFAAITEGHVVVDEASIAAFVESKTLRGGADSPPDAQEVRDALLIPYRSGHLFSDLEAAIILDATYGGSNGPLIITISDWLEQGFMVPSYRDKQVFVSQNEVADVLLGYPGALNSRWAHEMAHVVEFRSPQYAFTEPPPVGSRCEPLKYLMEYMWWVRRYPGDAPTWDWMPINSGLTLARLLVERFHNSGC